MGWVVCYATCWSCKFGCCYDEPTPHSWMDPDDCEAMGITYPASAEEHPCACPCAKEPQK